MIWYKNVSKALKFCLQYDTSIGVLLTTLIVSEWYVALFQPYHGKNKLIFNEMMMRSALY